MWERCPRCNRPSVCKANLWTIRKIMAGGVATGGILGVAALPLLGFGAGGVAAGSIAAGWQSSIGIVAAGSLFSILQSLGATGMGMLLFGSVGSALGLLIPLAARLNWCNNQDCDYNSDEFIWEKCDKCKKPVVCEQNLLKLRTVASGDLLRDCSSGEEVLSLIESEISAEATKTGALKSTIESEANPEIARSAAIGWQKRIGTHGASRLVTALQKSLGEDGLVVIFFGDIPSALKLLATVAAEIDWCKNACNENNTNREVTLPSELIKVSEIKLANRMVTVNETESNNKETPNTKKENKKKNELKEIFRWERCSRCNRQLVCESNVKKIRVLVGGGVLSGGLLGALMLPFLGFGAGGVAAGSFAAGWQSSIGAVTAGSLFAVLQSLGATGLGCLLFGTIGSALSLLGTLAVRLNWCNNQDCNYNSDEFMWEKCAKCEKPEVCQKNLLKLRTVAGGGFLRDCSSGEELLSLIESEISAEATKVNFPKWQSRVNSYAAHRLFEVLKSLEDTGLVVIIFGDIPSALKLLATVTDKMDWCRNGCIGTKIQLFKNKINIFNKKSNKEIAQTNEIIASSKIILKNGMIPSDNRLISVNAKKPKNMEMSNQLKKIFTLEKCPSCGKPKVCELNVWKMRFLVVGGVFAGGTLGTAALPLIGFGADGVIIGSIAAVWQSTNGAVAAGSLFSKLQSLSRVGFAKFFFGATRSALGLLKTVESRFDWCNDDCCRGNNTNNSATSLAI